MGRNFTLGIGNRSTAALKRFAVPARIVDMVVGSGFHANIRTELERRRYAELDLAEDRMRLDAYEAKGFMPDALLVQISRRCNLKCTMCGWSVWGRNKGFMSMELFKHVLAEARANNIWSIQLTNPQGEPLLSPIFEECLNYAISENFSVLVNTNCTPLGPKNIKVICDAAKHPGFTIQASFAGYDKETHESIYVGSKFEDTSRKLQVLNAALTEIGKQSVLTVNGVTMEPGSTRRHVEYLASLGIDPERVTISLPDNFAGIVEIGTRDNELGIASFKKRLDVRGLRLCGVFLNRMLVYDDGKVSACGCRDSEGVMEIGDLTQQSLAEIGRGARIKMMAKAFMDRDLSNMPLCKKCDIPYGDRFSPLMFQFDKEYAASE